MIKITKFRSANISQKQYVSYRPKHVTGRQRQLTGNVSRGLEWLMLHF